MGPLMQRAIERAAGRFICMQMKRWRPVNRVQAVLHYKSRYWWRDCYCDRPT